MLRALAVRFFLSATIVAAAPAVMLTLARAQQPAPSLTISQVDASKYPDVSAVVTVLDARGVPVPGLTAAQFQAFDDQTQLTVSGATAGQDASLGLSVVIVIDVSGSMAGDPLTRAKQAATEFAEQLGTNDEAALVAFNQQVTTVIELTNDRQRLTAGIAGLQAGGGTALYDAAQTSALLASRPGRPRRAVVLLTDGVNDAPGSPTTADGSLTIARDSGVPIFTVGFGAAPDAGYLQALSGATQGQYRAATAGTVSSVYADLATLLRSQYVVTIRAPGAADGKDATLQVIATVAGTPVSAVAPYKRGAVPAGGAPTQIAPATQPSGAPAAGSGTDRAPALVVGGLVAAAVAALAAYVASRWYRRQRLQRAQLALVAPNPRSAAAQGVPVAAGGAALRSEPATGRLTRLGDEGGSIDLTAAPVSIGSDAECTMRVPPSAGVAPRHALIWVKDQKIMLRHVGGLRRSTIAGGKPVEWVALEDGEEFSVGPHRFRAQRVGSVAPEARR